MSTEFETERKYTANGAVLPALDGVPGVAGTSSAEPENLDAVYFDTADLRLGRWGVTFRRRTGGHDEGWHLKLRVGKDTRRELHRPLGTEQPPGELVALLAGLTRGAELNPVARVSTDRRRRVVLGDNGTVLAELTEDQVSGQPLRPSAPVEQWREVEVELGDSAEIELLDAIEATFRKAGLRRSGDESKLRRVLQLRSQSTPGRKAVAGEAVLSYLTGQIGELMRQDVLVRDGTDDAVHQLRVAARRIRGILRIYGAIIDRDRTRTMITELRWLNRCLASARDLEVLEERLRGRVAALPDRLVIGPVRSQLTRYFAGERQQADQTVRRTIESSRYTELLDTLAGLAEHPPLTARASRPASTELPKHVRKAYRKIVRRLRDTRPGHDRALHRTRKAARRLRYAIEAAEPVIGKKARRTRKRTKNLTSLLGEFQDSVVARPVLRKLGAATHVAGANGFTFGLLYAREQAAAERAEAELAGRWERFNKRTSWFD